MPTEENYNEAVILEEFLRKLMPAASRSHPDFALRAVFFDGKHFLMPGSSASINVGDESRLSADNIRKLLTFPQQQIPLNGNTGTDTTDSDSGGGGTGPSVGGGGSGGGGGVGPGGGTGGSGGGDDDESGSCCGPVEGGGDSFTRLYGVDSSFYTSGPGFLCKDTTTGLPPGDNACCVEAAFACTFAGTPVLCGCYAVVVPPIPPDTFFVQTNFCCFKVTRPDGIIAQCNQAANETGLPECSEGLTDG